MLITHSNRVHCDISTHVYNVLLSYYCFLPLPPDPFTQISLLFPCLTCAQSSRKKCKQALRPWALGMRESVGFVAWKVEGWDTELWALSPEPRQRVLQLAGLCQALLDIAQKGSSLPCAVWAECCFLAGNKALLFLSSSYVGIPAERWIWRGNASPFVWRVRSYCQVKAENRPEA